MNCTRNALCLAPLVACAAISAAAIDEPAPKATIPPAAPTPKPFQQDIPTAAFKFDMLPIPGDAAKGIKPFYLSKTEITWEAFDVYIYRLDEPKDTGAPQATSSSSAPAPDAITRPTKPYIPPDRGFGHEGFAAIGMSHHAAAEFCKWLSAKSGRRYRLPTEAEWEHACLAGAKDPAAPIDPAKLADSAWFEANASDSPHPVGKKLPNAWGLCDMLGNIAEWCSTPDGKGAVRGGSYLTSADDLKPTTRKPNDRAWNASDPQMPKSKWWLANGPFIGFRVVCDSPEATADSATKPTPTPPPPAKDAKP